MNNKKLPKLLNCKRLYNFLEENKEFFSENNIHPYEIVRKLNSKQQKKFVEKIDDINLTLNEKKEILATLKSNVKKTLDLTNFKDEYKVAISIDTKENGQIILDLERKLEDYSRLDNIIKVNPEKFTEEQRKAFIKLCEVCPNLKVVNTINDTEEYISTANEYKSAEEWITSVIDNLDPNYSKLQKLAVIDNAIGKKISYAPDYDTEICEIDNYRSIWRIINSGYGICDGISKLEQYMVDRVDIKSEIVKNNMHSFLKVMDIEIYNENDKVSTGNTIVDPTWNLTNNKFGGKPNYFCVGYEEVIKKHKKNSINNDSCHKNDRMLKNAILNLDEKNLRELYKSVNITDENGDFPIKKFIDESNGLDKIYANSLDENVDNQLLLFTEKFPEFATYQNPSMRIIKDIVLSNEHIKFNRCVINRVYEKEDKEKTPCIFVYIDADELNKKFYFGDRVEKNFINISEEEFLNKFKCYDEDLKKTNGIKPWEVKREIKEKSKSNKPNIVVNKIMEDQEI
ncbi:MAG: hypothetical protein RSE41_02285 [Clostridia bacterium]